MQVVIFQRSTTPWGDLTPEDHLASLNSYPFHSEESTHNFKQGVELWNSLYEVPYVQFRKRLHEIQEKNFEELQIPICNELPIDSSGETIVIPMDDDDWLSPDLLMHLRDAFSDERIDAVTWNTISYNVVEHSIKDDVKQTPAPGYALRLRACTRKRVMWHNHFSEEKYHLRFLNIPVHLACYVRHPASTYLFWYKMIDLNTLALPTKPLLPDNAKWSWKYLVELYELIHSSMRKKS